MASVQFYAVEVDQMKVLVPVEDKEFGQHIVDYITNCKWPADTEFCVFNAIDPNRLDHFAEISFGEFLEEVATQERADAQRLVALIVGQLRDSMKNAVITTKVVEGHPKDEVLRAAKEWPADLIVIGSHGRNAVQRFLLGSVSMAVIGAAPCSVLLVRAKNTAAPVAVEKQEATATSGKMHIII